MNHARLSGFRPDDLRDKGCLKQSNLMHQHHPGLCPGPRGFQGITPPQRWPSETEGHGCFRWAYLATSPDLRAIPSEKNRPGGLCLDPERDKTAGAIASATTWLFLGGLLLSRAHFRFTRRPGSWRTFAAPSTGGAVGLPSPGHEPPKDPLHFVRVTSPARSANPLSFSCPQSARSRRLTPALDLAQCEAESIGGVAKVLARVRRALGTFSIHTGP